MPRVGTLVEQSAPSRRRIVERRRKRMLGREPVVDRREIRLGGHRKAPGDVAIEQRRPRRIGAAMKKQDVPAAGRLRRRDAARRNPTERARDRNDTGWRARHPPFVCLHASAPHLDADAGPGAVLDKKPRAKPHQLGLETRAPRFRQFNSRSRPSEGRAT